MTLKRPSIKINIETLSMHERNSYKFNSESGTCTFNGKIVDTNVNNDIFRILGIIHNWPEKLENLTVLDALTTKISIDDGKSKRILSYCGKYPDNFYELKEYLDEVVYVSRTL